MSGFSNYKGRPYTGAVTMMAAAAAASMLAIAPAQSYDGGTVKEDQEPEAWKGTSRQQKRYLQRQAQKAKPKMGRRYR